MGGDSPGEEGGKHAPGRADGISKGPEAGLAEGFQGLKEGHPRGVEGGWWVEARSPRCQAHGHSKVCGFAPWTGSSEITSQAAACSGLCF